MQTTFKIHSLSMTDRTQTGFTLYELLITLTVMGVVLAIGVPNFVEFRQNSRITRTANDFISAFQVARSESARAKSNITICASSSPLAAGADCDGGWGDGYIVFVDTDGDISRDAGEAVVKAVGPSQPGVELAVAGDATFFSFAPTGLGRGDVGGNAAVTQVVICDSRGNETAAGGSSASRLFVTTPLGRATILRDKPSIAAALTTMGKSCPGG